MNILICLWDLIPQNEQQPQSKMNSKFIIIIIVVVPLHQKLIIVWTNLLKRVSNWPEHLIFVLEGHTAKEKLSRDPHQFEHWNFGFHHQHFFNVTVHILENGYFVMAFMK